MGYCSILRHKWWGSTPRRSKLVQKSGWCWRFTYIFYRQEALSQIYLVIQARGASLTNYGECFRKKINALKYFSNTESDTDNLNSKYLPRCNLENLRQCYEVSCYFFFFIKIICWWNYFFYKFYFFIKRSFLFYYVIFFFSFFHICLHIF